MQTLFPAYSHPPAPPPRSLTFRFFFFIASFLSESGPFFLCFVLRRFQPAQSRASGREIDRGAGDEAASTYSLGRASPEVPFRGTAAADERGAVVVHSDRSEPAGSNGTGQRDRVVSRERNTRRIKTKRGTKRENRRENGGKKRKRAEALRRGRKWDTRNYVRSRLLERKGSL